MTVRTVSPGVKCAASAAHVPTTLVGATTRNGPLPLRPGVGDQRQGLQRLAEPHVVGEDPAEPRLPEERQPPEAVELVVPQLRLHPVRLHLRQPVEVAQRARRADPLRRLGVDQADLRQLRPQPEVVVAHPYPVGGLLLQLTGLPHQLGEPGEARVVDAQVGAVAQDDPLGPQGHRLEQLRQTDEAVADR